jgi:hypothetical protein
MTPSIPVAARVLSQQCPMCMRIYANAGPIFELVFNPL